MSIIVRTTRLRLDRVIRHFPSTANSKYRGRKISGFEKKSFTRQHSPDSKVFGYKVPTLDSGFKISGDTTKPGRFYFGFVHFCVNGKINPVLKRSGLITPVNFLTIDVSLHVSVLLKLYGCILRVCKRKIGSLFSFESVRYSLSFSFDHFCVNGKTIRY